MDKSKKSFVNGAAILGIAGLLCKIIGAFFRIPLRNMMGVAGMNYYSTVYPYYSALLVISSSGLPTAISKLVSERTTVGDMAGAKRIFKQSILLLSVIGAFTTCIMFFGADRLAAFTNCPGSEKSFRALAPALLFVSVMCAYRGYLQGLQKMTGTAISQITEQVGKLCISLLLAKLWLPYGYDIAAMGALLGITISEVLALIVIVAFYLNNRNIESNKIVTDSLVDSERKNSYIDFLRIIGLAIPVTIGASIMPLTGIIDTRLIKLYLLNTGFTKDYADMCFTIFRTDVSTVINMPAVLTVALAMSLVPAISESCAMKDHNRVHLVSGMGIKLAFFIGAPCAVGLYVVGGNVIDFLFTVTQQELEIGTRLMQISSIGIIFLSLVQTITGCIQGLGKPVVPMLNLILGAVAKIVCMIVLMKNPSININGAAWSTVVCYFVAGMLDMIYLIKVTHLKLNVWNTIGKPTFCALIMGVAVFAVKKYMTFIHSNIILTVLAVFVGIIVYSIMTIMLSIFDNEEMLLIPGGTKLLKIIPNRKKG